MHNMSCNCNFFCTEKYTQYSETPPMWTLGTPGIVFCIKRCPHFRGKISIEKAYLESVLNTELEVSLFQGCP